MKENLELLEGKFIKLHIDIMVKHSKIRYDKNLTHKIQCDGGINKNDIQNIELGESISSGFKYI